MNHCQQQSTRSSDYLVRRLGNLGVALVIALLCGGSVGHAAEGGQWVTPSGTEDPTGLWMDPALAYDGSTTSFASDTSNAAGDGPWLTLDYQPTIHSNQIQLVADYGYDVVDAVALEAQVHGVWTPLFAGAIDNDSAFIITFPVIDADTFRFRFHYLTGGYYFWLYDFRAYSQPDVVVLPQVVTTAASAVSDSSAVLHGQLTSDGGTPCAVAFQYRAVSASTEITTPWTTGVTTGQGASAVLLPITGLQSGVAYVYHLVAQSSIGMVLGTDVTFTPHPIVPGSVEWFPGIDVHPESTSDMTWVNAASAIDDDRTTAATCYHPLWTNQWSPFLDITLPPVAIDHVRLSSGLNPFIDAIAVDVQQGDGSWIPVYQGPFTDQEWQVYALGTPGTYPQARVRLHTTTTAVGTALPVYEFQVRITPTNSEPGPTAAAPVLVSLSPLELPERWNAAAWANDSAYRSTYGRGRAPARVWDVSADPAAPLLQLTSPSYRAVAVGQQVSVTLIGLAGLPVSAFSFGQMRFPDDVDNVTTRTCDAGGQVTLIMTVRGPGRFAVLFGSPACRGTIRMLVEAQ